MRESIQRMLMLGFVVFDKGVSHDASLKTKSSNFLCDPLCALW
jgi:hypothetical protein